jgi:hypothetical protein
MSPRDIAEIILINLDKKMAASVSPLIIDNTNILDWEIVTFFGLAFLHQYTIIVIEKINNFYYAKNVRILKERIQKREKMIKGKTLPQSVLQNAIRDMIETEKKSQDIEKTTKSDLYKGKLYTLRILESFRTFPDYAAITPQVIQGINIMKKKILS